MQVAATLTIALHARSLALPADGTDRAHVEAWMWIGACVAMAAGVALLIEAGRFDHGLKRADRRLHSPAWWRWHLLTRFAGHVLAVPVVAGIVMLGMSALERLL